MSFSTTTGWLTPRTCGRLPRRLGGGRFRLRQRAVAPSWRLYGIRGIQNFDGRFELTEEAETSLYELLKSDTFSKLVARECRLNGDTKCEFAELLFQPVPWSPNTRKGMPQEFEKFLEDPDYVIINIPPTVMFKAKISDPSRLCAIFKKIKVA